MKSAFPSTPLSLVQLLNILPKYTGLDCHTPDWLCQTYTTPNLWWLLASSSSILYTSVTCHKPFDHHTDVLSHCCHTASCCMNRHFKWNYFYCTRPTLGGFRGTFYTLYSSRQLGQCGAMRFVNSCRESETNRKLRPQDLDTRKLKLKVDAIHEKGFGARIFPWGRKKEQKSGTDPPDYVYLFANEVGMQYITADHEPNFDLQLENARGRSRRSMVLCHLRRDEFRHDLRTVSRT